jgi:hypothetical protein
MTITVDSESQRPASQDFDWPAQQESIAFEVLQHDLEVFLTIQQLAVGAWESFSSAADNRSNHSGGSTRCLAAQASFCDRVKQPQLDQHDCAFWHEHLQSIQGKGTDRSFTTGLGIENTNPLANAQTNSTAEIARRSRIG